LFYCDRLRVPSFFYPFESTMVQRALTLRLYLTYEKMEHPFDVFSPPFVSVSLVPVRTTLPPHDYSPIISSFLPFLSFFSRQCSLFPPVM